MITFQTSALKYFFERNFAAWKRNNPSKKICISRVPPARSAGDKDLPTIKDIKLRIGGLYNTALMQATTDYPNTVIKQKKLSDEEMENMPVNLKTKYKPFTTFWEYLCICTF